MYLADKTIYRASIYVKISLVIKLIDMNHNCYLNLFFLSLSIEIVIITAFLLVSPYVLGFSKTLLVVQIVIVYLDMR